MSNAFSSRLAVVVFLAVGLLLALCPAADAADDSRPNIVIIMADDMGYSDVGCYGSEIATPNIDSLAKQGIRFTQFYNATRCCPTRASLLTGLYPHRAGMGEMADKTCKNPPSPYQGYLNDRCVTIAEVLGPAGYHVLMSGKWHVGECRPHWPLGRGFDRYFGLITGASNYFRLSPRQKMALDNEPFSPKGENFYMTDAFTDYALEFLEQTRGSGKPFFLYLPYTSPHWPLHALPEDIAKYRGKYLDGWEVLRRRRYRRMIELGIIDPNCRLSPSDAPDWDSVADKAAHDLEMAVYAAQIDRMDQNVGRVLAKIEDLEAKDNTLIIFLSDNGGCCGELEKGPKGLPPGPKEGYHSYGKSWANASNTPFRRYKRWLHEGGISTPLIAYWPAKIRAGQITHQPGHVIDLMATCVDVAGAEYPKTRGHKSIVELDGKSLMPLFKGENRPLHEVLYWEHCRKRAVREGDWKLVALEGGPWELYNLREDRSELVNLVERCPDKAEHLESLYKRWAEKCGVRD